MNSLRRLVLAPLLVVGLLVPRWPVSAQESGAVRPRGQLMREVEIDRSVAELVADGWNVVGLSQAGPVLAYHLVHEGKLAICYFSLADRSTSSLCYQLAPVGSPG